MIEVSELIRALEAATGQKLLPHVLTYLMEEGYVDQVIKGDLTINELSTKAQRLLDISYRVSPEKKVLDTINQMEESESRKLMNLRLGVLSEIAATWAAKNKAVLDFREAILNNKLIDDDEVESWIINQAKMDGEPSTWLKDFPFGTLMHDSKKNQLFIRHEEPEEQEGMSLQADFHVLEYYSGKNEEVRRVLTTIGGVLETLRILSNDLAYWFSWRVAQATNFVLSGKVPTIKPVEIELQQKAIMRSASRIVLTIDPTLTAREVIEYYKIAREEMLFGKRYRSLNEKNIYLAEFYFQQKDQGNSWGEIMNTWNEQYPKFRYGDAQINNFSRDCKVALDQLLEPMNEEGIIEMFHPGEPEWEGEENE